LPTSLENLATFGKGGFMREQQRRWSSRGVLAAVGSFVVVLLMAGVASAIPINDVGVLVGGGPTEWDPFDRTTTGCLPDQRPGFTPVDDGSFDGNGDAFDTGLVLSVSRIAFRDPDNNGQLSDEQLHVGPGPAGELRVERVERALQGSPTLRSLIVFHNPGDKARERRIQWDSNLGSDGDEGVRGTSDGDTSFELNDRWLVTSDAAADANLDDPPLVFVLWGRFADRRTTAILEAPGDGCLTIQMRIRVPAHSTRYLLFFTEMHDDDNDDAVQSAQKFNNVGPSSPLLNGLGPGVRNHILNWNL
jgi:hypothetical protein